MYIPRDMTDELRQSHSLIQVLVGPRQCGKSTLFAALASKDNSFQEITFDDLQLRQLANRDPALFLYQFLPPLILDEIQYVPNLFPELKKQVDQLKRKMLFKEAKSQFKVLYRLTGSNQILMDKNVKESLAGRAAYFHLNTLTVHEIISALPKTRIDNIIFRGGWPELYTDTPIPVVAYLNDYIRTYVEKDIVMSAGIQKVVEFHSILGLLSARTAQLLDYSGLSRDCGVSSVTVKEWTSLLERSDLIYILRPYFSKLNKRLIKTPKLYFLDTGLATRLQGWQEMTPLITSPQIGPLFETLVLAEIIKFIRNYRKQWEVFFWRTKEGEEVDFVLKTSQDSIHAIEVKLAIQNLPKKINYPTSFQKYFSPKNPLVIVTFGGRRLKLSDYTLVVPITELHDYLKEIS